MFVFKKFNLALLLTISSAAAIGSVIAVAIVSTSVAAKDIESKGITIPSLTTIPGRLLTGAEATISHPTTFIIGLSDSQTFNGMSVNNCSVMAHSIRTDISTGRAALDLGNIACIGNNGEIYESKIYGYVLGSDGRQGLKGAISFNETANKAYDNEKLPRQPYLDIPPGARVAVVVTQTVTLNVDVPTKKTKGGVEQLADQLKKLLGRQ